MIHSEDVVTLLIISFLVLIFLATWGLFAGLVKIKPSGVKPPSKEPEHNQVES